MISSQREPPVAESSHRERERERERVSEWVVGEGRDRRGETEKKSHTGARTSDRDARAG